MVLHEQAPLCFSTLIFHWHLPLRGHFNHLHYCTCLAFYVYQSVKPCSFAHILSLSLYLNSACPGPELSLLGSLSWSHIAPILNWKQLLLFLRSQGRWLYLSLDSSHILLCIWSVLYLLYLSLIFKNTRLEIISGLCLSCQSLVHILDVPKIVKWMNEWMNLK